MPRQSRLITGQSKKKAKTCFPVLDLPPEVRNRIWTFAVVSDVPVVVARAWRPGLLRSGKEVASHAQDDDQRRLISMLAVAFTCRRLYQEIIPIYYSENTFKFVGSGPRFSCLNFMKAIGPQNTQRINSISVDFFHELEEAVRLFPGLKTMDVRCFCVDDPRFVSCHREELIACRSVNPMLTFTHLGCVVEIEGKEVTL